MSVSSASRSSSRDSVRRLRRRSMELRSAKARALSSGASPRSLAPVRLFGRRLGDHVLSLAALGAIGIALGRPVSLLISEYMPLFGFMESGYRLATVLTFLF